MKAREVFDKLVGMAFVIGHSRGNYKKPGALLERLSDKDREALKDLRAEHINDRID